MESPSLERGRVAPPPLLLGILRDKAAQFWFQGRRHREERIFAIKHTDMMYFLLPFLSRGPLGGFTIFFNFLMPWDIIK